MDGNLEQTPDFNSFSSSSPEPSDNNEKQTQQSSTNTSKIAEVAKVIGLPALIIITINSILGTGVYFLPAVGARESGAASIISWVIMSVYAMGMAAVFAELSGMFSFGGGVYEYCKEAFGKFTSFLVGWMTMLAGYVTIAMLIVGAISYLLPLGGISTIDILGFETSPKVLIVAVCFIFILMFNYVAYLGMETGTVMLVTFGFITMSTLMALIVPAWSNGLQPGNFEPFMPKGPSSVFLTLFFIAETFFGWESVCFFSPQVKNGKKNVPRALLIGTFLIVLISLTYVFSMMNGVGANTLGSPEYVATPISRLGEAFYGPKGYDVFTILCFVAIIGSVAGWIVAAPDLIKTLAADKLFPAQLSKLHPVRKTPYKAIIFQTVVVAILTVVAAGSYESLLHLLLPMVLVLYSFVIVALLTLRVKKPNQERTFKLSFAFPIGIFLILFNMGIVGYWVYSDSHAMHTVNFGLSLIAVGIPLFILLLMYFDPGAIRKANDMIAHIQALTDVFFVPRKIKRQIFEFLGNIEDKEVLEYGCGVGTLTKEIARRVSPDRRVYAVDISEKQIQITNKRIMKDGHEHVILIHDEEQVNRLHPDVGVVDVIISMGMLSYMQDVRQILKDMSKKLKRNGKICFVDYVDFFKILPNNNWIEDPKEIEDIFHEAGLSVNIEKKKGLFWNYLFITGIKTESKTAVFI
ncbi:MAG: amino acid permease [Candidatus Woesearchaeota archaeon]